jgi:tetratricopeptide (TPR) repeat protein
LKDFDAAVRLDPKSAAALTNRGRWYMKHGDYPKALADYQKAIDMAPREWPAYNGLARVYATAPEFEWHLRDGDKALAMASKACELSHWSEWQSVASLAAAHAELGDFTAAVKWQKKAIAMSLPAKEHDRLDNEKRLARYESGQAYFEEVSQLKSDLPAKPTNQAETD